ncbi:hypothetical protein PMEGAPR54_24370 [Priestia megaterium]
MFMFILRDVQLLISVKKMKILSFRVYCSIYGYSIVNKTFSITAYILERRKMDGIYLARIRMGIIDSNRVRRIIIS